MVLTRTCLVATKHGAVGGTLVLSGAQSEFQNGPYEGFYRLIVVR